MKVRSELGMEHAWPASTATLVLEPGELLYLPPLYVHHITHASEQTIAVNPGLGRIVTLYCCSSNLYHIH
jgi:hypothetical protein